MKKLIVPLVLLIVGIGGGVGAGLFFATEPEVTVDMEETSPCGDMAEVAPDDDMEPAAEPAPIDTREYARMNNQFVVPVVSDGKVSSLIVMSLTVEVEAGGLEAVFSHEPRLRDAFLQVMFDHANMGGFNGAFTASSNMRLLREALQDAADGVMRGRISDVLIVDIVRQDVSG